jgi:DnaK suppressor protein
MGPADLQRYKRLLLEKRRVLSSAQSDDRARVPAAGGFEGNLIDQANTDAEPELQIRLHQTDGRLLRAIEEALGRIRQGTYGICGVCNQRISRARLEAVPWTHHCRACKERKQSNGAVEGRS